MTIDCPHCGRREDLLDGGPVPATVLCPGCRNEFSPAAATPALGATAPAATADDGPRRAAGVTFVVADRPSLTRSFIRYFGICFLILILGGFVAAFGAESIGRPITYVGVALLAIGIPAYLVRAVWRMVAQ